MQRTNLKRYLLTTIYKVQVHNSNHFGESKKIFDINIIHRKIFPRNFSKCPSLIFPKKISFYRNFRADNLLISFARVIDTNQLLHGLIAGQPHFFLYDEHSIDQRSTRCSRYPDLDTEHVFQSTLTLTVTICRRDTRLVPVSNSNCFVSCTCPLYVPQSESRKVSRRTFFDLSHESYLAT